MILRDSISDAYVAPSFLKPPRKDLHTFDILELGLYHLDNYHSHSLCATKLTEIPFVGIVWRLQLHSALLPNEYSMPFNNSLNSQMPWK